MSANKFVYATDEKMESLLDQSITRHFLSTLKDQNGKVAAEYVWIGGTKADMRSKTKTLDKMPKSVDELPHWNYDGSSTGQAPGHDSEVYLIPRAIFKDPFRPGDNILVMCDCYEPPRLNADGTITPPKAIPTNTRAAYADVRTPALRPKPGPLAPSPLPRARRALAMAAMLFGTGLGRDRETSTCAPYLTPHPRRLA